MGSHSFLQGIFLPQGSNPGLPYCRQILYHLSHQGKPRTTPQIKHSKLILWVKSTLRNHRQKQGNLQLNLPSRSLQSD